MKIQTLLKSHTNNTEGKIINRLASESDFNSNIKGRKINLSFLKVSSSCSLFSANAS